MDAHPVSFTSAAERRHSRIWKDLSAYRHFAIVQKLLQEDMSGTVDMAAKIGKRRAQTLGRPPRVGIVGAGLSGLRCADILIGHGFEVTMIEGRNRLGGRVHQVSLTPGHLVDAGPNWIHGTNNNPIMELAQSTNTLTGSWTAKTSVVDETGKMLPPHEAEVYSNMMWEIIGAAFTHSNRNTSTISPDESLLDFFNKELARRIPENSPDWEKKRKIMSQIAESWGAYVGNHVFSQSLKYFWLEECIDGENLFCSDTYQKILAAVAKPAVERAAFKYKTVVNKVQTTDDELCEALKVHTESGETLEFDEVVFTAPLGWLKRHPETFTPALPARLAQAIRNIGYGCLEKVYISFETPFWRSPSGSDEDDTQGFIQLLAPNYALETNPHRWNQECVELASFTPADSHPTLLFYTYGDQSKYLTSEVAKIPTKEKRDAFLYEWFQPYYSRLPNYREDREECKPVGCYATEWLNDELAGNGSYSNFQVGLEEGDRDVKSMREGVPERGLWFAGEHTSPFVALGTVTGAYWSGESVGKRIAVAYGRTVEGEVV
ncbi:flavin-containing amine oxidoreductase [Xylaria bambusicola]|uniref:flavin-containing amine oxidoreductase n=1 Tax=Xylaria bambusicola TaxID=326684 RepID=UPI002008BA4C|nr:flavin-containing amine oxidoreductase [Xylaria bambusicola]KAI0506302.1 flavin-containing amine oxidoreductase [Xylaria bambusicola]